MATFVILWYGLRIFPIWCLHFSGFTFITDIIFLFKSNDTIVNLDITGNYSETFKNLKVNLDIFSNYIHSILKFLRKFVTMISAYQFFLLLFIFASYECIELSMIV